ncbi:protein FAM183A-like [Pollicipes pollicipes]|uniref:protein FAM183A-like n=1 Tax=Pollicipes pollicipes TaxID=41117 RepID=UPI0018850546|nr:protein FAM183A-like [Pollicipes pollicipes]
MAQKDAKNEMENLIAENQLLTEAIKMEEKHIKLVENYGINPFRKREALAGKPNSPYDVVDPNAPIDTEFINTVNKAKRSPTEKFECPQTAAQEYGWFSRPLLVQDRADRRYHHQHKYQDITLFNEFLIRSCPTMIKGDN